MSDDWLRPPTDPHEAADILSCLERRACRLMESVYEAQGFK
jgi:hypothetical protein